MAILESLIMCSNIPESKLLITTDSLSALQGISQLYPTHAIIQQIKDEIFNLHEQNKNITFIWVPSHVGIEGNEEVDLLASKAASDENVILLNKIPHSDHKGPINAHVTDIWQSIWTENNTKMKEVAPHIGIHLPMPDERREQVVINRLRIGHTRLTHQYLLKKEPPPICLNCNTQLTIKHLLTECPMYEEQRQETKLGESIKSQLTSNLTRVLQFLKDIELYSHI